MILVTTADSTSRSASMLKTNKPLGTANGSNLLETPTGPSELGRPLLLIRMGRTQRNLGIDSPHLSCRAQRITDTPGQAGQQNKIFKTDFMYDPAVSV
jgi:hypothetical protein